jgi:hypothetical protein
LFAFHNPFPGLPSSPRVLHLDRSLPKNFSNSGFVSSSNDLRYSLAVSALYLTLAMSPIGIERIICATAALPSALLNGSIPFAYRLLITSLALPVTF